MQNTPMLALFNSTITTAIDADDTSIVLNKVTSIDSVPFNAILDLGTSNEEVVRVTAVTTTSKTLTVVRAQGGTTGVAHAVGSLFHACEIDARMLHLNGLTVTQSGASAVHAKSLVVTDTITATSSAEYTKITFSGTKTGGAYGINHFLETFWSGDVPNAVMFYSYAEIDGNKTIGRLTQMELYCGNRGNAVTAQYDIVIGRNSNAVLVGPGNDAFIYCREHSTVQEESSVIMLQGNNAAEYLIAFGSNPSTGKLLLETSAAGEAVSHRVRCNTTLGVRWLHLHTQ